MERHPVDLLSLVTGSTVLGLGLLLLSGGLSSSRMEWAGPAVAIGLGVVILAAALPRRGPTENESASIHGD